MTTAPQTPDAPLTWVKRQVTFETFAADVDACNSAAYAAGEDVQERRGDPMTAFPLIMVWRWLEDGFAVNAAMTRSYEACFKPRGYALAYVDDADARAFTAIAVAPLESASPGEAQPPRVRAARMREAQLRHLHTLATAERPRRAHLETRHQRRPLVSYVSRR